MGIKAKRGIVALGNTSRIGYRGKGRCVDTTLARTPRPAAKRNGSSLVCDFATSSWYRLVTLFERPKARRYVRGRTNECVDLLREPN